jgi:methenyltetrahydromethanopterin cyclohydrolase
MVSVNLEAKKIVDQMIEDAEELNITVSKLENGSTVIDCGVNVSGSFKAGELYTKVCLGGLAEVGISIPGDLSENFAIPSVKIKTNFPSISTLGAQKAGWSVSVGDFFALGSGPARALALKPAETYKEIEYKDDANIAILTLEADKLPGADVADSIAADCNVSAENVFLLAAPTSSLVGSIQIAGRVVENGTYKMLEFLKFNVNKIRYAAGIAPIAPVDPDGLKAMGKTNDAVLFGGRTYYYIESEEGDDIKSLAEQLPSSSSSEGYGKPFYDVFKEAEFDFYKIDKGMFAPAEVVINDLRTGEMFRGGAVNVELLMKSFGL